MPVTLPIEVYDAFEKGLGKEDARKVAKSLEVAISEATEYKWKVTKDELLDAIRKEFITKELFDEKINTLKVDFKDELLDAIRREFVTRELFEERINTIEEKMNTMKVGLEGKIEKEILRIDRKFTIMFVILFFTIIFLNQNALEFMAKVLGLIK